MHPQSICLVIDVYLGHVLTLDPKITDLLACHSRAYESAASYSSKQTAVVVSYEGSLSCHAEENQLLWNNRILLCKKELEMTFVSAPFYICPLLIIYNSEPGH